MADYNRGNEYNKGILNGGFAYNQSAGSTRIIKINETFSLMDYNSLVTANITVAFNIKIIENFYNLLMYNFSESFVLKEEKSFVSILLKIIDSFKIQDFKGSVFAKLSAEDEIKIEEAINVFGSIISEESFAISEDSLLQAILSVFDTINIDDYDAELKAWFYAQLMYETIKIVDHEAQQAESAFLIVPNDDNSGDLFLPFGFKVDWKNTDIPFLPPVSHNTTKIQGVDGEIVTSSSYGGRVFDITAYSEQGLTIAEKENLKVKVANILNSMKDETKKFTVGPAGISFDVLLTDQAKADSSNLGYVKFTQRLKAPSPYGESQFENIIYGSGLLVNDGNIPVGPIHEIGGPCENPSFTIGGVVIQYNGTITAEQTLIINSSNYTCTLKSPEGDKNVIANFNGNFVRIPLGSINLAVESSLLANQITTRWKNKYLYGTYNQ